MKFTLSAIKEVFNLDPLITLDIFILVFILLITTSRIFSHLYNTNSFQSPLNSFSHVCVLNFFTQKYFRVLKGQLFQQYEIFATSLSLPMSKSFKQLCLRVNVSAALAFPQQLQNFYKEIQCYSYTVLLEDLSLRCNIIINVLLLLKFYVHLEWTRWKLMQIMGNIFPH